MWTRPRVLLVAETATRVDHMYDSDAEQDFEKLSDPKSEPAVVVVDGREFQVYRLFFGSRQQAANAGYYPRSHWTKLGRDVVDVAVPAVVVVKSWRTFHPAEDELVLGWTKFNEYLVSTTKFIPELNFPGCWFVFCEGQTEPQKSVIKDEVKTRSGSRRKPPNKVEKKVHPKSSKTTSPSPLTTPPYDVEDIANNDANVGTQQDLRRQQNETRLITKKPKSKGVEVYFPEGFDWDRYPDLNRYRSRVLWLGHKLHERRFLNAEGEIQGKDAFITINSALARNIAPNFSTVVKLLVDLDIIERDFYQPKSKSYGYRFADPQLRKATRRRVPLNDAKMVARINKHRQEEISTRTDRWLHGMLFQLALADVDQVFLDNIAGLSYRESGGSVKDKLEAYRYWLERIAYQEHVWSRDDQGRRYSIITNLKRELRSLLRVDGQRLMQIDLRNSQWLFLALEMRRAGIACREYSDLCQQGLLYEAVAERAKSNRSKVKKALTQRCLFSPNDAPCQRTRIKRAFDRLFPEVAKYLFVAKRHGDGSRLAKTLQAAEAELIIDTVCGRLRREGKVKFTTPVHDSLLFLPQDGEYIQTVMEQEFAKLGMRPRLESKEL